MQTSLSIQRIDASQSSGLNAIAQLRSRLSPEGDVVSPRGRELTIKVFGEPLSPSKVVERICRDIREQGTTSLLHYCQALDGKSMSPQDLRVPAQLLEDAHKAASSEYLNAIRRIRENIQTFQSQILHKTVSVEPRSGVHLQQRYLPLERIGICVPGGAAAYPSTVLMTAVPAQVAGVEQIVVVAPPTKLGAYNPDVLAACHELGIREVYAMGGAQAVAALAYGTDCVQRVDKIVGPGNLFVALAKKLVYGTVDIDSIAGPSEVVVLADESTNAAYAAADMLAQAEHSPGSSVLITCDPRTLDRVEAELDLQVRTLERSDLTIESLNAYGALILAKDWEQACELTNDLAPEHLHIATKSPRELLKKIRNAGATFIGNFSPVALGDYAAGPSHVLPTGGTARWASGLSANDFLRAGSVIEFDQESLRDIAAEIELFANKEGLTAHRRSITMRLEDPS